MLCGPSSRRVTALYCSFLRSQTNGKRTAGWLPGGQSFPGLKTSKIYQHQRGKCEGQSVASNSHMAHRGFSASVASTRQGESAKKRETKKKDNTPVQSFPLRAFLESGVKVGYGEGKGRRTVSGLRPLSRERKVRKLTYSDFRLLQGVRILTLICVRSLLLGRVNA